MGRAISKYDRSHSDMFRTCEPFRQGSKMLALVSEGGKRKVTFSVLASFDLDSGDRDVHELE